MTSAGARAWVAGLGVAAAGCAAPSPLPPCPPPTVAPLASPPSAPADLAAAERDIHTLLDDWHDAAAKADESRYFDHLADDAVFLGTDETERWTKEAFRAYAHPHFAKGKAWTMSATRRAVVLDPRGDLAHFDEDLRSMGLGPARGSGVVVRRGNRWLVLHYNLAITVPNPRFDGVKEAAGSATLLPLPAAAEPIAEAAILSGAWLGTTARGTRVEEHWTDARAGSVFGIGRATDDQKTTFFELMRVEARPGGLVFVAQPRGKEPVAFERVEAAPGELVFVNPKHDWPKKITYRREGQRLHLRAEGAPGQPVESVTLHPALVERR